MKKKLIPLIALTLSLAVSGIVMGFTLSGGSGVTAQEPARRIGEPTGNQHPIRSDEGIDPYVCNYVHNITSCDGDPTLQYPPLPNYEDWHRDYWTDGGETLLPVRSDEALGEGDRNVVTSIDDIDPNVCNGIHNINACSPEELEQLRIATVTSSIAIDEYHTGVEVEAKPEPLFVDGEAQYQVHYECGSAAATVYVSVDGEFGCVIFHDFEDGGGSETKEQPPVLPSIE